MQQVTSPAGRTMHFTSRPFELNKILQGFAEEVGLAAASLSRSTNLEAIAAGVNLQRAAAKAEADARHEMLLEPELETC